jgi:hypothetical protein
MAMEMDGRMGMKRKREEKARWAEDSKKKKRMGCLPRGTHHHDSAGPPLAAGTCPMLGGADAALARGGRDQRQR